MSSKLFNPIKNKVAATIALLFFVLLGAGTIVAMKAPDAKKTPTENNTKRANSNFYVYTSSSTAQADIQNINNYASTTSDPCGGTTTNVCGVTLSTSKPAGQKPVAAEFSAESGNLWTSQQNHTPADGSVSMKP